MIEAERNIIYLDNNATTQIDPRVLDKMMPFLTSHYANASSSHRLGVHVNKSIQNSRKQVAALINAQPNEIVFTSGATEAINLAIKGVAEKFSDKGAHIITVATEHSAVLDTCKYLETKGYGVTYLGVNSDGLINIDDLNRALRKDTVLVSVMYVNNETGVIQPIKEIASLTRAAGAVFMTDATQAVGKIPIDVGQEDIDLMCLSGHKMYAPKGVGALYIRRNRIMETNIIPLIHGGGHENGYRSGTLNVPAIVALGKACELLDNEMHETANNVEELRDQLELALLEMGDVCVNGSIENRLYNTSNLLFKNIDSDMLITRLSNPAKGHPIIAVSNGSACTSAHIEPSHVLMSMGLKHNQAFSSLRFSLGKFNTREQIYAAVQEIKSLIGCFRSVSK